MGKLIPFTANDDYLLKGCRKGKSKAQKAVYDKYAPRFYSLCLRYARQREDAEEILANGFVKIFKNIKKFRNEGSFEGWMRTIMVREALNFLKAKRETLTPYEDDSLPWLHHDPADGENEEHLMTLVQHLPKGYRIVFNMYALEGYSHAEIAKELHISENTSRSQLLKARRQLQQQLKHSVPKISNDEK